jgi:hypothetical protein
MRTYLPPFYEVSEQNQVRNEAFYRLQQSKTHGISEQETVVRYFIIVLGMN